MPGASLEFEYLFSPGISFHIYKVEKIGSGIFIYSTLQESPQSCSITNLKESLQLIDEQLIMHENDFQLFDSQHRWE